MPEDKNSLAQKYQQELSQKQQVMQQNHLQKVQAVDANLSKLIADVAKQEKLDYVFAKGTLVFGGQDAKGTLVFGGQDITQKVADAMVQEK